MGKVISMSNQRLMKAAPLPLAKPAPETESYPLERVLCLVDDLNAAAHERINAYATTARGRKVVSYGLESLRHDLRGHPGQKRDLATVPTDDIDAWADFVAIKFNTDADGIMNHVRCALLAAPTGSALAKCAAQMMDDLVLHRVTEDSNYGGPRPSFHSCRTAYTLVPS
jgi:hypothetical protein